MPADRQGAERAVTPGSRGRQRAPSPFRLAHLHRSNLKLVPIEACSLDDCRKVIDVNQVGCWLGMKSALGALKAAGGGSIVDVS
ncbi:hypothetical protein [Burkholderia sp. LMG 21824]|uniref:hypothetical protein n=1 Tax=Burkholderia sp. LMG 21824 TaxID=3158172 RepID=UPI003C2D41B0